jgi:outer membrane receptor protein involved in Fe transport
MRFVPRVVFLTLGLLVLLVLPPAAAPTEAPGPAPDEVDSVPESADGIAPPEAETVPEFFETTTVTARPVSSATGSVTVVGPEELAVSGARSGSEVLEEVGGLNLLPTGGRSGVTHAWIRGADPNFTLVLLDGIPINDPTDRQGGAVNLEEIPRGLVERAEVVRGPQTSFYGMSALSGVVQLFTPRGGAGRVRASLGAEAGNADLRRGFARVSGGAGRGGWSAGVVYDEERFRIASERFQQVDTWATADLALGADADLVLTARFALGEQDDYPNGSGGPAYGTGELRRTDREDLALGARPPTCPAAPWRSWSTGRAGSRGSSSPSSRPCAPRRGFRTPWSRPGTSGSRGCP